MHILLISYGFHKMLGISCLAENRLASQEGLRSMEQVNKNFTKKENIKKMF